MWLRFIEKVWNACFGWKTHFFVKFCVDWFRWEMRSRKICNKSFTRKIWKSFLSLMNNAGRTKNVKTVVNFIESQLSALIRNLLKSVCSCPLKICTSFAGESSLHRLVDNKYLFTSVACKTSSYKSKVNSESIGDRLEASSTDSFSQAGSKVSDTTKCTFHTGGSVSRKSPTSPPTFVDYRLFRDARGLDAQYRLGHGCDQPGIIRPAPIHHQPSTIRGHMPKLNVVLPQSGRFLKASECRNKPASSTTWVRTELKEDDVYNCRKISEMQTEATANDEIMFVGMEARHDLLHKVEENKLFSPFQQNISSEDESSITVISLKVSHVGVAQIFLCIRNLFHSIDNNLFGRKCSGIKTNSISFTFSSHLFQEN